MLESHVLDRALGVTVKPSMGPKGVHFRSHGVRLVLQLQCLRGRIMWPAQGTGIFFLDPTIVPPRQKNNGAGDGGSSSLFGSLMPGSATLNKELMIMWF